jgi:hypothetical protein
MKNNDHNLVVSDYECDDEFPCSCTKFGIEGEWDSLTHCWRCVGCNQMQ